MAYQNKLFPLMRRIAEPKRPPTEDELRATGRTTGLALSFLGLAVVNPGHEVVVSDHHDSQMAHAACFDAAVRMAADLGLKYMTFNRNKLTIRSDVLEWVA